MRDYIDKADLYKSIADREEEYRSALLKEENYNTATALQLQGLLNATTLIKHLVFDYPTVDAAPVCCKDCIHRPQWKNRDLYPPGYWGDNEADIDWTCPLIDRNELRNSWYMDDDFYCPKGERS